MAATARQSLLVVAVLVACCLATAAADSVLVPFSGEIPVSLIADSEDGEAGGFGDPSSGLPTSLMDHVTVTCTSGMMNETCVVKNQHYVVPPEQKLVIASTGPALILDGTTISRGPCEGTLCKIWGEISVHASGAFVMRGGSRIAAPSVSIQATTFMLDNSSAVDVSGMGYQSCQGRPGECGAGQRGGGGSYCGVGSKCEQHMYAGVPFGDYGLPRKMGGPGSVGVMSKANITRGGGIVYISALQGAEVYGSVLSNGESAPAGLNEVVGGAAGGAIHISSPTLATGPRTVIAANGGDGAGDSTGLHGGGGGGGCVSLQADVPAASVFQLKGGSSGDACPPGGAASVYMRNSTKLACGSDAKIARAPQSETYLYTASPNAYPIDVLSLVGCSMAASTSVALLTELVTVTATRSRLVVPTLTVSGSVRLLEQSWLQSSLSNDFEPLQISAGQIDLTNSIITGGALTIRVAGSFSIASLSVVKFSSSCAIYADTFSLSNNLIESWIHVSVTHLLISATTSIGINRASVIAAGVVKLEAPLIAVKGTITARQEFTTQCGRVFNCSASCGEPLQLDMPTCMFSVLLNAELLYISRTGSLQAGAFRFCVKNNATINGAVVASDFGCPATLGPGVGGDAADVLPTGGGGHGGAGGEGLSKGGVAVAGGGTYDDPAFPQKMGSGGGGNTGGAGGGVIVISIGSTLEMNGGLIAANGQGGLTPLKASGESGGGGGSGGSVRLTFHHLFVTHSLVTASGGIGGGQGGGGGGGIVTFTWTGERPHHVYDEDDLQVQVFGGQAWTHQATGYSGAKSATPACGPGKFGVLCAMCPPGTFKSQAGQFGCTSCAGGTYYSGYGATECLPCPPGTIAANDGSTACIACEGSLWPSNDSRTCGECRAGYHPATDLGRLPVVSEHQPRLDAREVSLGAHGMAASATSSLRCFPCSPGHYKYDPGNTQCLPCDIGFASPGTQPDCTPCVAGRYAPTTGSPHCLQCSAGTWSPLHSGVCWACSPGQYAPAGAANCSDCPANSFAAVATASCKPCSIGSYSSEKSSKCTNCTTKPEHAHYTSASSSCDFECDQGYLRHPKCLSPVQISLSSIGDWYIVLAAVVVLMVVAIAPVLVDSFSCCSCRGGARTRGGRTSSGGGNHKMTEFGTHGRGWASDAFAAGYAPLADWGSTSANTRTESAGRGGSRSTRRASISLDHAHTGLEPDDLPSHLHRVYLHGHNQPYSPAFMDPIVPVELQTIVKHAEYAEYAEPCNRAGAWARWELRVMWALALLYYPTAPAFAAWVRKRHMQRVLRHHLTYDHAFLRNTRARSLANSLKFGVSSCDTLAWVDVLCMQNEDTGGLVVGQPRLPLVLVCAGDGSYFVPFHLDLEDTLVIEGLRCLGKDWWVKAAQLNSLLRTVARGASSQTLEPLSAYLSVLNASIDNSSHAPVFVAGLTHATTSRSRLTRLAIVVMPRDAASATEAGRYHVPYDTRLLPPKPSTLASSRDCCYTLWSVVRAPVRNFGVIGHKTLFGVLLGTAMVCDITMGIMLSSGYIQLDTIVLFGAVLAAPPFAWIVSPLYGMYCQYRFEASCFRTFATLNLLSVVNAVVALAGGAAQQGTELGVVLGIIIPSLWLVGKALLALLINVQAAHAALAEDQSVLAGCPKAPSPILPASPAQPQRRASMRRGASSPTLARSTARRPGSVRRQGSGRMKGDATLSPPMEVSLSHSVRLAGSSSEFADAPRPGRTHRSGGAGGRRRERRRSRVPVPDAVTLHEAPQQPSSSHGRSPPSGPLSGGSQTFALHDSSGSAGHSGGSRSGRRR